MSAIMGGKPKMPDTSKQDALIAKQEEQLKAQMAEEEEQRKRAAASKRARGTGTQSLLTGLESGVLKGSRETLG